MGSTTTGDKDAVANQHQSNMGAVDSQRRTLGAPDPTKEPNTDSLKNGTNQSISDINKYHVRSVRRGLQDRA